MNDEKKLKTLRWIFALPPSIAVFIAFLCVMMGMDGGYLSSLSQFETFYLVLILCGIKFWYIWLICIVGIIVASILLKRCQKEQDEFEKECC